MEVHHETEDDTFEDPPQTDEKAEEENVHDSSDDQKIISKTPSILKDDPEDTPYDVQPMIE